MLFGRGSEWGFAAQRLGFALHERTDSLTFCDDFASMKEDLGPRALAAEIDQWMYGVHRGHEVLARIRRVHHNKGGDTFWTHVMTGIDPPLFLGLDVSTIDAFSSLFMPADIPTGELLFDKAFTVRGFEPYRTRAFLARNAPLGVDLLDHLLSLSKRDLSVSLSDNVIDISTQGVFADPIAITSWLDSATWIAEELTRRRQRLPHSPGEAAQLASWQAFADAQGLAFDPARLTLTGRHKDLSFRAKVVVENCKVATRIKLAFPTSLGLRLSIFKEATTSSIAKFWGSMQDIRTGDPAFDGVFVVQGHPVEIVQQLLAPHEVRGRLLAIFSRVTNVFLNDHAIELVLPGSAPDPTLLLAPLDDAAAFVRALTGFTPVVAPYR
jgi:hypothetical protein